MADSTALQQQSQSILSEKVSRALQVRTDTPAMKAALDALSNLHPTGATASSTNATAGSTSAFAFSIDSRSVRGAIEQDALQQALLLQDQLRSLVATVQELRQGVSEVAAISQRVREATLMPVITAETPTSMIPGTNSQGSNETALESPAFSDVTGTSKGDTNDFEEEEKLARVLSDAFLHRDLCRKRLEAVHSFLEKFNLSQEDSRLLDHYAFEDISVGAPVLDHKAQVNGLAFLHALERVRQIRLALTDTFGSSNDIALLQNHDLETSLDRRGLGASSALRMMENLAQKQERAYERLYHWLQQYLHLFSTASGAVNNNSSNNLGGDQDDGLDEALQHPFVRRSLYTLRHVPAFYSHTLELIASSRRAEETRRFLLALTSGYAGFPPIEMKAHDPVAYVGDMLAFSFKAFSTEADLATGLLQYSPDDDKSESESSAEGEEEKLDSSLPDSMLEKPMSAYDMLSMSMSGLARPLKSRILQVVANLARRPDEEDAESDDGLNDDFEEEGTIVRNRITHLYEISGLLLFYNSVIEKGIQKLDADNTATADTELDSPDVNPLIDCLMECLRETTKAYEATVRAYGAMLSQICSITGDTEANQAKTMLALVAEVRLTSPGFSKDVECPKDCQPTLSVDWVTVVLVDAALSFSTSLDEVLALNQSLADVQKAGLSAEASSKLNASIIEKEESLIKELVESEAKKVMELCGLGSLAEALRKWQDVKGEGTPMATFPGLLQEEVESAMKHFYASLYSPPLPSLETVVRDPFLRKKARSGIAGRVCSVYSDLYEAMTTSSPAGYEDLSFLVHKPEQVNTLFSA